MKALLVLATLAAVSVAQLFHAQCRVYWTVGEECDEVQHQIIDQMILWELQCDTPSGPGGFRCNYQYIGSSGFMTNGTHTMPGTLAIDDLVFTFSPLPQPEGGCFIDAYSRSREESIFDDGLNYCNLFNLMDGTGLTEDPKFQEDSSDAICTQYSESNCTMLQQM